MSLLQMAGGVAVAGAVAVGGTALTGTGLTSSAGASQYIGGSVSQSITSNTANLTGITYSFTDTPGNTTIGSVSLAFTANSLNNATSVSVTPTGGAYAGTAAEWVCASPANTVVCTVKDSSHAAVTGSANGWQGLTSLAVTVA